MLKLGLIHAMLLDQTGDPALRRRRALSDALVRAVAPMDAGRSMLGLLETMGLLDRVQVDYYRSQRKD